MAVKPIPEGYHTITPYLIVEDADKLVEFIEKVFDGKLLFKMENDDGKISHGEFKIGDSMLMFAEASEEWKPTRTMLHLYVEDADTVYQKAWMPEQFRSKNRRINFTAIEMQRAGFLRKYLGNCDAYRRRFRRRNGEKNIC